MLRVIVVVGDIFRGRQLCSNKAYTLQTFNAEPGVQYEHRNPIQWKVATSYTNQDKESTEADLAFFNLGWLKPLNCTNEGMNECVFIYRTYHIMSHGGLQFY